MTSTISGSQKLIDLHPRDDDEYGSLSSDQIEFISKTGRALPAELERALRTVIDAVASGRTVTVTAIPDVVSTSTAASMLGVSRPTLMSYIENGRLNAVQVGQHFELRTSDVIAFRDVLAKERSEAIFDVMRIEHELETQSR